jgi:hypothetical protein
LSTWLLLGACLQTILVILLPKRYALTPAITLLAIKAIDTALITYGIKANPYLQDMLPKKSTAQIMNRNGDFAGPGQEKVAVLLLGAKSNHPLGIFAPDFGLVNKYIEGMTHELENDPSQDTGC